MEADIDLGAFETYIYQFIEVTDTMVLFRDTPLTDKNKNILPLDAATFQSLGLGYFIDKHYAYGMTLMVKSHSEQFYLTPIPQLDRDSFKSINLYYAKDKDHTYFADNGKVMKSSDLRPLTKGIEDGSTAIRQLSEKERFRCDIVLNDHEVYYRGKLLKEADPKSFCKVGRYWYKDIRNVYFVDGYHITKHPEFDATTFIGLGYHGTDKYKASATVFHNSAPESLVEFLPYKQFFEKNLHLSDYWYFEAKAKRKEQTNTEPMFIGNGFYTIDDEVFCYEGSRDTRLTRVLDCTTANFKLLSNGYATNGTSLFLLREELWSYFLRLRQIKLSSGHNIEVLSEAWVYDGTYFYYKAMKKCKADRNTFVVLNHIYAYNQDGLFCDGVRKKGVTVSKDVQVLGGVYLKMDGAIYYMGKQRKTGSMATSKIKMINDFIIIGANGAGFNHGKYRSYMGDFEKFHELENGHWGDGTTEWKIGSAGLESVSFPST